MRAASILHTDVLLDMQALRSAGQRLPPGRRKRCGNPRDAALFQHVRVKPEWIVDVAVQGIQLNRAPRLSFTGEHPENQAIVRRLLVVASQLMLNDQD